MIVFLEVQSQIWDPERAAFWTSQKIKIPSESGGMKQIGDLKAEVFTFCPSTCLLSLGEHGLLKSQFGIESRPVVGKVLHSDALSFTI
jgi:hypothetical protein